MGPFGHQPIFDIIESLRTIKLNELKDDKPSVPQTMKPQEKPDVKASDHSMEDYSGEDLDKPKDKGKETGACIREVPDKELQQINDKSEKCDKKRIKRHKKIKEQLRLCNECGKTFRSNESLCTGCKSEKTEKIGIKEREHSDMCGTIKHVYKVDYELDGKPGSIRVEAFDEDDAKVVVQKMKPGSKATIAKKIGESKTNEDKIPGGLADRSGKKPEDFDKEQLEAGIKVEMEHTTDAKVAQEIAMDHLTEDPEYYVKLKKMEAGKCESMESDWLLKDYNEATKKYGWKTQDEAIAGYSKLNNINPDELRKLLKLKEGLKEEMVDALEPNSDKSKNNITIEIMFSDLSPEKQKEILDAYGIKDPKEMNWDVIPFDMINTEDIKKIGEKKSKICESVLELVGEVSGITASNQRALRWAIDNKVIPNEFPHEEVMFDELSTLPNADLIHKEIENWPIGPDVEPGTESKVNRMATQIAYLKYVLLPKAIDEYSKIESKLKEQVKDNYTVTARGIVDRNEAEKIARESNGMVVQDDVDEKKFMIMIKDKK